MMVVDDFPLPPYGAKKLIRHGAAIERLTLEREQGVGEFAHHSLATALAFDAADFVWAALMLEAPAAQKSKEIRNHLAEGMLAAFKQYSDQLPPDFFKSPED